MRAWFDDAVASAVMRQAGATVLAQLSAAGGGLTGASSARPALLPAMLKAPSVIVPAVGDVALPNLT